jgi:hypothetical protein
VATSCTLDVALVPTKSDVAFVLVKRATIIAFHGDWSDGDPTTSPFTGRKAIRANAPAPGAHARIGQRERAGGRSPDHPSRIQAY